MVLIYCTMRKGFSVLFSLLQLPACQITGVFTQGKDLGHVVTGTPYIEAGVALGYIKGPWDGEFVNQPLRTSVRDQDLHR